MSHNLIYIINNKLHNNKYKLYTILFYLVIIHSYYSLYINLYKNNYTIILIYFSLLFIFYIKYKKFSYFICYPYILISSYFIKSNFKEGNLAERVAADRAGTESELNNESSSEERATPCESYIIKRLSEKDLELSSSTYNTNS